jgi:hypothetical protein
MEMEAKSVLSIPIPPSSGFSANLLFMHRCSPILDQGSYPLLARNSPEPNSPESGGS